MTRTPGHLTAALMIAFFVVWSAAATDLQAAVSVGDHPTIDFKSTDGTRVTSDALRGRLVVVDFWATWCGPCVKAVPHMIELNQQYAARGVQIIGVSLDRSRRDLDRFVRKNRMPWPQYFDADGGTSQMSGEWGVRGIPRIFILSPEGEVLWVGHPANMDKPFKDALKKHPPTPPTKSADDTPSATRLRDDAVNALRKARAAIDAGDAAGVLSLISQVPDEVLTDRRVLGNARVLLAKLELNPEVADALKAAEESDPNAVARLTALTEAVNSKAPVTDNDPKRPAVHPRLVASKLALADKARDGDNHYRAYTLYNWLLDRASETEEGHTAAKRIAEYETDQEKMAVIRAAQAQQRARSLLSLARSYETAGNHEQAKATYEQVLAEYESATECCDKARAALAKLD